MDTFEEFKVWLQDEFCIWSHNLREVKGQLAKCKKCEKLIKCCGGSTGGLHNHLKLINNTSIIKKKKTNINRKQFNFQVINKNIELLQQSS